MAHLHRGMSRFELAVRRLLDRHLPCCAMFNIPIYRPVPPDHRRAGYEIDHLLHVRSQLGDRLIVVECKDLPVFGDRPSEPPVANGKWQIQYNDRLRDLKQKQLLNHAAALYSYLFQYDRPLAVDAWCLCSRDDTPSLQHRWSPKTNLRLLGIEIFAGSSCDFAPKSR